MDLPDLVTAITEDIWGMPVRWMEAVLEHGDAAVEPALAALDRALEAGGEDADEALTALWPVVLLGELGSADAVPSLVRVVRVAAGQEDHVLAGAAAEALARIGPASLGGVRSLLEAGGPAERTWAYAAAGWIRHDDAYALLLGALTSDLELADVVATALADQGRAEAVPALLAALEAVAPWQRVELESAIVGLHHGEDVEGRHRQDWRLRYRVNPSFGSILPGWPGVSLILREHDAQLQRTPVEVRSLEQILADPLEEDEEPDLCDCCGVPVFQATGVDVCPASAAAVAMIQSAILGHYRTELETDDVFNVLEAAEQEELEVYHVEPEPRSRKGRRRREERLSELLMARRACTWLVGRGIESVGAGRALLLAESRRLADIHGDPEGVFDEGREPAAAPDRVGRNDPCPCGSGRKYKKCCGAGQA